MASMNQIAAITFNDSNLTITKTNKTFKITQKNL